MYDLIVIGGGPGGYAAAIRASQLDAKVALVEADTLGGTCVNRGCIPIKVWMKAASSLKTIKNAEVFGIKATVDNIDYKAIKDRIDGVSGDIRMGMGGLLGNYGVKVIEGKAVIKSPKQVDVAGKSYEGKSIIIATGSRIVTPDIPGLRDALMNSEEALRMDSIPESVLVYGAGPMEVEFATLLSIFGSKVTLLSDNRRIVPFLDQDSNQRLTQVMRENGITVIVKQTLASVKKAAEGFECKLAGGKVESVNVKKILCAPRKPMTDGLGLDNIGIKIDDKGAIIVDECLQTSVSGVYAIGDVVGRTMQSHAASAMAVCASENAVGRKRVFPSNTVPVGAWSYTEAASVGISEDEADDLDIDVVVGEFPYAINGFSMAINDIKGTVRVVACEKYGKILGVQIVGPNATELIGEAVTAMQFEYTISELARSIHVHPTLSENVVDAARAAEGWALYLPKQKK